MIHYEKNPADCLRRQRAGLYIIYLMTFSFKFLSVTVT